MYAVVFMPVPVYVFVHLCTRQVLAKEMCTAPHIMLLKSVCCKTKAHLRHIFTGFPTAGQQEVRVLLLVGTKLQKK